VAGDTEKTSQEEGGRRNTPGGAKQFKTKKLTDR
jgi:hypothetical protein